MKVLEKWGFMKGVIAGASFPPQVNKTALAKSRLDMPEPSPNLSVVPLEGWRRAGVNFH